MIEQLLAAADLLARRERLECLIRVPSPARRLPADALCPHGVQLAPQADGDGAARPRGETDRATSLGDRERDAVPVLLGARVDERDSVLCCGAEPAQRPFDVERPQLGVADELDEAAEIAAHRPARPASW